MQLWDSGEYVELLTLLDAYFVYDLDFDEEVFVGALLDDFGFAFELGD